MLNFKNDYSSGACPQVLEALCQANRESFAGYGMDERCQAAASTIRQLCGTPDAGVHFLMGGTQANKTVANALLRPYEAIIAADSGHICVHEAGAIEQTGHRILSVPSNDGKVTPAMICKVVKEHISEHMVVPKMVYISNTTELGAIYSCKELAALHEVCDELKLYLYCDGARLGSAIASGNTTFSDYGSYADIFTIGGTKNGLLFGEAVVISNQTLQPYFRHCMKQQGAILAKGWLLGIQFQTILESGLYLKLAEHANRMARSLAQGLLEQGMPFLTSPVSNQLFPILPLNVATNLAAKVSFETQQVIDESNVCVRFVTSWDTQPEDVSALLDLLQHEK